MTANVKPRTLRDYAIQQLDESVREYDAPFDREAAIERWVDHLIAVSPCIPDDILDAMPEISRSNDPYISPQQYECGCVAVTRITDRDGRTWLGKDEKPFEMRLAQPCDGTNCEVPASRELAKKYEAYEDRSADRLVSIEEADERDPHLAEDKE